MFSSAITKNSDWEILTKNLVTLQDKLKDERLNNFWGSRKNLIFRGFMKNQYIGAIA